MFVTRRWRNPNADARALTCGDLGRYRISNEQEPAMAEPIRQEVVLPATPGRIYSAYMDSAEHEAFTNNGPASISDDVGGAFSCHGGAISGRNATLVAGQGNLAAPGLTLLAVSALLPVLLSVAAAAEPTA